MIFKKRKTTNEIKKEQEDKELDKKIERALKASANLTLFSMGLAFFEPLIKEALIKELLSANMPPNTKKVKPRELNEEEREQLK